MFSKIIKIWLALILIAGLGRLTMRIFNVALPAVYIITNDISLSAWPAVIVLAIFFGCIGFAFTGAAISNLRYDFSKHRHDGHDDY